MGNIAQTDDARESHGATVPYLSYGTFREHQLKLQ